MTELTEQQQQAIADIRSWYHNDPIAPFRLFGPAGTGKTTLARDVPRALGLTNVHYGAYTGKAASVLRGKGCNPAATLHSLVYVPMPNAETRIKLAAARQELIVLERTRRDMAAEGATGDDELDGQIAGLQTQVAALEKESKVIGFEWNPDSPLAYADLLILDEVSMVDAKLAADIERFEIPVLVLGDPEQLEPIGGEGYYTDATPDFLLTEIHRQALESPVLELATRIRTSTDDTLGLKASDFSPRSIALAMEADQVLCWKNGTRWAMINLIRSRLGYEPGQVDAGDRIMCLTNNKGLGIFNGQQFTVMGTEPGSLGPRLTVQDDAGYEREILAFQDGFAGQRAQEKAKSNYLGGRGQRGLFTFSQCITVHKAQGSQWDNVFVINESGSLRAVTAKREGATAGRIAARRWLYTAVSRAAENVTVTAS